MCHVTVLLSLNLLADRRRLGVVDETKTLVALSNPFSKKGNQQTVALGGAGISRYKGRKCAFRDESRRYPGYPCSAPW
jgi:hypothetical protein